MSKKYKGKPCVYCVVGESAGPDHVIAREFFPKDERANLPKVPCCKECNNTKASLEHYATTIYPFGSHHENANGMIEKSTAKRLKKNIKLKKELKNKMGCIWLESKSSLVLPTITIPISGDNLTQLFAMIIKGLYWTKWNMILPKNYFVEVYTLSLSDLIFFRDNLLYKAPSNFIQKKYGKGVFQFSCTRGDDDPGISAWEMFFL